MTHQPVLLKEVVAGLKLTPGEVVVDGTVNRGGHAKLLGEAVGRGGRLIGIDRDHDALAAAEKNLKGLTCKVDLLYGNFRELPQLLESIGVKTVNAILLDIGISSEQLDISGRGFSFQRDEPLLMTMNADHSVVPFTAADIVNTWSEQQLADAIYAYGEERLSRQIAKAIVLARREKRITSSSELAEIISATVPDAYHHGPIHPATRTFQALRIAVNDELGALKEGLREGWKLLAPGGRLAVITFHSLEGRIVKDFFNTMTDTKEGEELTNPVIKPSDEEIRNNPRSRSAQLRICQKLS